MAKFKVRITHVEYYDYDVVVEAGDQDGAIEKVEKEWQDDDYLYEKATDCATESKTDFWKLGLATDEDTKYLMNIN